MTTSEATFKVLVAFGLAAVISFLVAGLIHLMKIILDAMSRSDKPDS